MDALVIIDMQKAYFADDALRAQQATLVKNIQQLIDDYGAQKKLIINVRTLHSENNETWTLNMLQDDQGFLFEGSEDVQSLVHLPANAIEVYKTRDSAFHETDLIHILRKNNVSTIALAGVSAHTCVFHTAAAAYAYNIRVELIENAIGDEDKAAMKRTFEYLEKEYRQQCRYS